mmetsp:Transcript_19762/g.59136  ORF Transcript_19762/g.59136 Transcript_19762/m.59136 type:complete len:273 (+) Transcript_19762:577-1395(+)
MATMTTALSKYSCSGISMLPAGVFSKPVSAVSSRHFKRLASLLSQSSIIVFEKWPEIMSSWCFTYNGRMISFNSSANSKHLIFDGLSKRSIMPVTPPCFRASVWVSQPYWINFEAYPGSMPAATILSKHSTAPVCNMPHKMVCSPIKSLLTSAMKLLNKTPARCPPVAAAYALASSRPSPLGSFSGCTAMSVGTPKPRLYSSRTSVPGHFGATMMTVKSSRTCMPSSTMLKPWLYERVAPCFINGITWDTTALCCLSGVKFSTKSASGMSSS